VLPRVRVPGSAVRNPDAGGQERSRCYGVEPAKYRWRLAPVNS
jgi:hypothetical protein